MVTTSWREKRVSLSHYFEPSNKKLLIKNLKTSFFCVHLTVIKRQKSVVKGCLFMLIMIKKKRLRLQKMKVLEWSNNWRICQGSGSYLIKPAKLQTYFWWHFDLLKQKKRETALLFVSHEGTLIGKKKEKQKTCKLARLLLKTRNAQLKLFSLKNKIKNMKQNVRRGRKKLTNNHYRCRGTQNLFTRFSIKQTAEELPIIAFKFNNFNLKIVFACFDIFMQWIIVFQKYSAISRKSSKKFIHHVIVLHAFSCLTLASRRQLESIRVHSDLDFDNFPRMHNLGLDRVHSP